jgi:hypothetical protein
MDWKPPRLLEMPPPGQMQQQVRKLAQTTIIATERQNLLDMVNIAAVMLQKVDDPIMF